MVLFRSMQFAGAAMVGFGALFHMQGRGVVGPEQSFMYQNPDWITHGVLIGVAGIALACAGTILSKSRPGRGRRA